MNKITYPQPGSGALSFRVLLPVLFLILLFEGCSTSLNVQNAANLGTTGKEVAKASISNIFASDCEYRNAIEAEIFFHSYAGQETPEALLDAYHDVQAELVARKAVFTQLSDVYAAFSELASNTAPTEIKSSIIGLGNAVNEYAATVNNTKTLSKSTAEIAGEIAQLILSARKKQMINQSSVLIRERLIKLSILLEDPLVQKQMTTFKQNLAQNRASAIQLLWKHGLLDPSPMINQMTTDIGFKAGSDALTIVRKNNRIRDGLEGVMTYRLKGKIEQIEKGYGNSVKAVRELIKEHEKLEKGEALTYSRLHQIITELQKITELLSRQH